MADAGSGYFLPIPYDLPPVPYGSGDKQWCCDEGVYDPPDRYGSAGCKTNHYNHHQAEPYVDGWWLEGV